jgi:DNA-binding FrmR family transcriptional regulator
MLFSRCRMACLRRSFPQRFVLYTIGGYTTVKEKMHTVEEKPKLILRIKRIKGQIAAIERALEADEDCSDVLQLITAARGAMNGLMAELLEGHIRFHVIDPKQKISSEQALAADELIDVVRSYLK